MKNITKNSFFKAFKILSLLMIGLFISFFFTGSKGVKASEGDYKITFHDNEVGEYSRFFDEFDILDEIPSLEYYVFVGWYDNESFTGENYYGTVVDENTPSELYSLTYYKDPALDDLVLTPYLDGYEIVEYTGVEPYLYIPSYYYIETETTDLYIVKEILSINANTFANNNNVTYITIPETVTNIDEGTFSYLNDLAGIYVYEENSVYSSDVYDVLFNKDQTEILHVPTNLKTDIYVLPESVETIKKETFLNTKNIKKIVVGSNVVTIENEAFKNNLNLEVVIIEDGNLERIEEEAFLNNSKLVKVMIPETVTYVGRDAFSGSNLLLDIYYQDEIANIPSTWHSDWNLSNFNVIEKYDSLYFTVTYLNDDDSIIDTEVVYFNKNAVKEVEPVKESDLEYSYYFSYFEGDSLRNIVSDVTVKAVYYQNTRYYTVTFHDALNNVYGTMSFPYGENEDNNYWYTDVKKEADAEYTYYFERWDKDLTFISSDLDVYPIFRKEVNYYAVIFYADDNYNQFDFNSVPYNTYVGAPALDPTKDSTEVYNYVFAGWYLDLAKTIPYVAGKVTSNIEVFPKFDESLRTYKVEFFNNYVLYDSQDIVYGGSATAPTTPTKASTDKYHFVFSKWSVDFSNIVSYLRVDAVYKEVLRSYTVNFYNEEVLIDSQNIYYGKSATAPTDPTKSSTAEYSYTFAGWSVSFNNITNDLNVYATYNQTANSYTVSYDTDGGTLISSHQQTYNTYINKPTNPTKTGYTFGGFYSDSSFTNLWDFDQDLMVANNLTLYAKFTVNSYTITFNSNGGSSISPLTKDYNDNITAPVNPTKVGYTFTNWYADSNLTNLFTFNNMPAENITLYAGWLINEYTVKFYNDDNTYLEEVKVKHGDNATYNTPLKSSTAEFNYVFSGWSLSVNNVVEDLTVYAQYDSVLRSYTITFYSKEYLSETNTILKSNTLTYGSTITPPDNPTKASTQQYSYTFSGWDKEFSVVSGDLEIYPIFTKNLRSYTVLFIDDDYQTVLKEEAVLYGRSATAPIDPVKAPTAKDIYTFSGWSDSFSNITSNLTIYATYTRTTRTYTVNFYNDDLLLKTMDVEYGKSAVAPSDPKKPSTPEFNYPFTGWNKDFSFISGELDVYAVFGEVTRQYTVYFYDDNRGYLLGSTTVNYGEAATLGFTPEKQSTAQYDYTFIGWDKDLSFITETMQTYAIYSKSIRSYTVTFYDELGEVILKTENVLYGNSATAPTPPTKESTEEHHYIFTGWNLDFSFVDGNMKVYANFLEVLKEYQVSFYSDGLLYKTVTTSYGASVNLPANPTKEETAELTYTFINWYLDDEFNNVFNIEMAITENINLYAKYSETTRSYIVNFYNENRLFDSQTVLYGTSAITPITPTKDSTVYYMYIFKEWSLDYSNVVSDLNIEAVYTEVLREYSVYFYDNVTLIATKTVFAGEDAEILDPVKASTAQYDYTFLGWDKDFTNVLSDLTVYAIFTETLREYTAYFYNDLNEVIKTELVPYGSSATAPTAPEKASTEKYNYIFTGWNIGFTHVYNDLHIYPKYSEEIKTFTVNFYNLETLISSTVVNYGETLNPPEDPVKEETEKYTYTFTGWDKDFSNVISDLNIYAVYDEVIKTFTVAFYNDEGTIKYFEQVVTYGLDAIVNEVPTKRSNHQYDYIFAGWDKDFTNITSDLNVYAIFNEILKSFTVNFYVNDELKETLTVNYGTEAVPNIIPVKEETDKYKYTFIGWSESLVYIHEDLDVYAIFKEEIKTFIVTFYNDLQTEVIKIQIVDYGNDATAPVNVYKEPTEEYEYVFISWSGEFTNVKENINVYPIFTEEIRKYTIRFYTDDLVLLKEELVLYNNDASAPDDPVKEKTPEFSYIFTGWDKDFNNVKEDLNVIATYNTIINSYDVVYYDSLNNIYLKETLPYGTLITPPEGPEKEKDNYYTYTFVAWSEYIPGLTLKEDLSFTPVYSEEVILYTVIIMANRVEHRYNLPYLSLFPNVNELIEDTNKYTYIATSATTNKGEVLDNLPEVVLEDIILTITYTPYIKVSYLKDYLNEINFNSIRSYASLVEAYNMLDNVIEPDTELLVLFTIKASEYNNLVEKTTEELLIVKDYENKIFNGLLEINISLSLLTYALYIQKRRWF